MCWGSGSGNCAWWAFARGGSRVGGLDAGVVGVQVVGCSVGEAAGLAGCLVIYGLVDYQRKEQQE